MKNKITIGFVVVVLFGTLLPAVSFASLFPVVGGCQMATPDSNNAYNATLSDLNSVIWCLAGKIESLQAQIAKLEGNNSGSSAPTSSPAPAPAPAPKPISTPSTPTVPLNPTPTITPSSANSGSAANTQQFYGPLPPKACVSYTAYGVCVEASANNTTSPASSNIPSSVAPAPTPKAPSIGSVSPLGSSIILQGNSGSAVQVIQSILKADGSYSFPSITGYFGTVTEDAVKAFQSKSGLQPTGLVDRLTLQKLESVAKKAAPSLLQKVKTMLGE